MCVCVCGGGGLEAGSQYGCAVVTDYENENAPRQSTPSCRIRSMQTFLQLVWAVMGRASLWFTRLAWRKALAAMPPRKPPTRSYIVNIKPQALVYIHANYLHAG